MPGIPQRTELTELQITAQQELLPAGGPAPVGPRDPAACRDLQVGGPAGQAAAEPRGDASPTSTPPLPSCEKVEPRGTYRSDREGGNFDQTVVSRHLRSTTSRCRRSVARRLKTPKGARLSEREPRRDDAALLIGWLLGR